ncbi:MAG: LapA family protein [Bryobacterales bacterium]|nr:LapA family protein [Bryobacterales bacterium]
MRITNNLASTPFARTRALVVFSALFGALLAAMLCFLVYLNVANRWEARETRARIAELQAESAAVARQQAAQDAISRDPRYAEALEETVFINSLLRRKGISWTRLFDDLETVLPYNVRVLRIRPQVTPSNEVFLDMDVASETGEPVIQMLRRMESSPVFGPTAIHSSQAPTESDPLYRYRVSVNYMERL